MKTPRVGTPAAKKICSNLLHPKRADHRTPADRVNERQGMQHEIAEMPGAEPDVPSEQPLKMQHREHDHDQYAAWDGRAFEIFHLAGVVRERVRGGIETRETADAARDE